MKRLAIFLLLIVLLPAAVMAKEAQKYTCPMHPHYIADAPGTCPICGMDLVPVASESSSSATGSKSQVRPGGKGRILYYKHPMGKPVTSPVPKKDEMGMDYIPVYDNEAADAAGTVTIAPEMIQNMGVRTALAEMTVFGRAVRAFGTVAENTRLQSVVAARVDGWIEDLKITAVGDTVRKGDLLFRLYSPDLIAAQRDYLGALASGSRGRVTSSARRLESLGVQEQTVEALRTSRKAEERLPIRAEHDGVISRLNVREGAYVKPGDTIAVIQDYSFVWVNAALAEKDLALLAAGLPARLRFPSLPGREIKGEVDYIHPTVDPQSRTGQVRLVLENPQGALRPGAYADVTFHVNVQKRLAIPSEAILRNSEGSHVILALGGGRFQPRRIEAGLASEGRTEIVSGLTMNDNIVVSGQFLIDSESALRESFRKLQGSQTKLAQIDVTGTELALLDHFVDAALYLHETLAKGEDVTPHYLDAALQAGEKLKTRFGKTQLEPVLDGASGAVHAAQQARTGRDLEVALSNLVTALKPWLVEGRPGHYRQKGLRLAADHGTGRLWLQRGKDLSNPYSGAAREIPWPAEASPGSKTQDRMEGMKTLDGTGADHEHH